MQQVFMEFNLHLISSLVPFRSFIVIRQNLKSAIFQRIFCLSLYYDCVLHSGEAAWKFTPLVGEREINCFHPHSPYPQHKVPVFRLSFDMQMHIHDIYVSLFVLMLSVYLTSSHASLLLDRSDW
jgi:hypothetical protein